MDFVVVGLGLGALGILLGVLMAGVVATLRERAAARAASGDESARSRALAAEQREIGRATLGAGTIVLVVTSAALAAGLDDRIAAFLVAATISVAAASLFFWTLLYRRRHPLPPRPRRARPVAATPAFAAAAPATPVRPLVNGHLPDLDRIGREPDDDDLGDAGDTAVAGQRDDAAPPEPAPGRIRDDGTARTGRSGDVAEAGSSAPDLPPAETNDDDVWAVAGAPAGRSVSADAQESAHAEDENDSGNR